MYVVVSLNTGTCRYTMSKYVLYIAIAAALILTLVLGSIGLVFTSRRRASRHSVCRYNWGTRTWHALTPSEQQRILQFYTSTASTRSQWTFVGVNIRHPFECNASAFYNIQERSAALICVRQSPYSSTSIPNPLLARYLCMNTITVCVMQWIIQISMYQRCV